LRERRSQAQVQTAARALADPYTFVGRSTNWDGWSGRCMTIVWRAVSRIATTAPRV